MKNNNLDEIKNILLLMFLNAYCCAGEWCFSLEKKELEGYIPRLEKHFKENGFDTEIFVKDPETDDYNKYKELIVSIILAKKSDEEYYNYYREDYNEICFGMLLFDATSILEKSIYDKKFIEIGSFIITGNFDVFNDEQEDFDQKIKSLF